MILIFDTLAAFDNRELSLRNSIGIPFGNTNKYAEPIIHPVTGKVAMTIHELAIPHLTVNEKANLKELTDDWFPAE